MLSLLYSHRIFTKISIECVCRNYILPRAFSKCATFSSLSDKRKLEGVRPRLVSGIQPTGVPHVGNYLGAIQHWNQLQDKYEDMVVSIVDLHSITVPQNPVNLRRNILDMAACLIACGMDSEKMILFQQSSVSYHAELGWILGCMTTMNRLEHLPQWKEKSLSSSSSEVPLGLFTYPVLQAADILLYKATEVPVGDDQVKHVELARHLAKQFNSTYGCLFPIPKPVVGEFKRIKSLRNPLNKMSKSEKDPKSRIELTDSADDIRDKIRKSVSDFTNSITYDPENRPGISNLVELHSAFSGLTPEEICEQSLHLDTLGYKKVVADVIIEQLKPIREKICQLRNDPSYLIKKLEDGNERAKEIARDTFESVRQMIGCK